MLHAIQEKVAMRGMKLSIQQGICGHITKKNQKIHLSKSFNDIKSNWKISRMTEIQSVPRRNVSVASALEDDFEPELIIFDKDGTLIDFKHMWASWAETLCKNLEKKGLLDEDGMKVFTDALGFTREDLSVSNTSPICCSPMNSIESICIDTLSKEINLSREESEKIVKQVWHMPKPSETAKPLTDLGKLFSFIKEDLGMKIAVCTTDDRDVTEETLRLFDVHLHVDKIICGNDKGLPPKPSPEQIWHICETLDVSPSNTVMVGDTITDMKMGAAAQVGLNIGIPNGAGTLEDLSHHADLILPTMDKFSKVITHIASKP